ncbi:MAG: transcription initiation factor IIB [Nitrosopumilaceae archaeon]|jgi:transcription initiation factor TFIIB|uniref:Transcription initiation factor IIB n=3 Tax=Candidatus Nitrosomaritimum aestuariumsis TaxID=3342354 RepID=A0AC60W901_9ARCH|nr:transcription initiation factor IIB [Nitrosopumilaceae archaeon]MBA4454486.1 transcription initiation factor IIB [Nitrosopumilaceae archaeon]MBA4460276.1 transcription initiation factor IIB [Nitrosopumilaceae archaeon]MBA4461243.1 transcription initiation factor IIB [Nitrosopumilaceae archaeon]MBA4463907.1 transcription initiation factor IIB [Nitrosopumilaceae archaeon]
MLKSTIVSGPKCPSCNNNKMVTDQNTGELFCGICGFVVNDKISDTGAEWRSFANDDTNRTRVGAGTSLTMHDMGLSTIIGTQNKDSTGKPLTSAMKSSIERLRTWDSRTQAHSSAERNLRQALNEMDKLKDKLALTDAVIEKAAYIYRKSMEKKLVRGRSIQGLVAACLYASCRNTETPRTLDDIAKGINIRRKDVARCYRLIFRELELKMPVVDPVKGVSRIASIAKLTEKSKRKAINILEKAKKLGIVAGKDPMGIAAAALYLACISTGESKSQKDISIASGVTEVTIRNRCAGLRKMIQTE